MSYKFPRTLGWAFSVYTFSQRSCLVAMNGSVFCSPPLLHVQRECRSSRDTTLLHTETEKAKGGEKGTVAGKL
eukprot:scaffold83604_cov34-Tisochrysis_lutea.AAC.1